MTSSKQPNSLSPSLTAQLKSWLPVTYLIVGLLALRWTIVEPYVVPTGSMEPTLKTGDRLYALKCAYDVRFPFTDWVLFKTQEVKRGDIILFRYPNDPSIIYVKRAVGLPGDHVSFNQGRLFINDQEVARDIFPNRHVMYDINNESNKTLFLENLSGVKHYMMLENLHPLERQAREQQIMRYLDVKVPEDSVFALGDNRDNSSDGRFWGFVPMKYLKGRAMFIWFSSWEWRTRPERIGTLLQ